MVENLAYALRNNGCGVCVVVLQSGETLISRRMRDNGIDPIFLGKHSGIDFSVISRLSEKMREYQPDVVHSHLPILHYVVPAARQAHITNRVHTVHNIAEKETSNRLISAYLRICYKRGYVKPVALSEINRQSMIDFYGMPSNRIEVVPNGIDLSRFKPKENYVISGKAHIVHIGRFAEAKNHICMIKAAQILRNQGKNFVFDLYGEGELLAPCQTMAHELGLQGYVSFHGLTDQVPEVLQSEDIFMLPSLWEGIPMVLAEAMAAGMPIVASNAGGIPDMIRNGVNGVICKPDPEDLALQIARLLDDEDLRKRLGKEALETSPEYSADLMAKRYIAIYEKGME